LALVMAVFRGILHEEESVVCLTGLAGSKRLDTLLMANPKRDFPWFGEHTEGANRALLGSREFLRLFDIALKFATEGREGKPLGTIFVLGEPDALAGMTKPLIINPCEGHPKRARSIHDESFVESMRELAALDGAFIIDRKGVVEQAGVYLSAAVTKRVQVEKGLGARHMGAAALTAKAEALAIVISESSGKVTVYSEGTTVMSLGGRGEAV
ncbi:MAG: diadenylate cyclase, partial [Verrucomicrobiota bacterium]